MCLRFADKPQCFFPAMQERVAAWLALALRFGHHNTFPCFRQTLCLGGFVCEVFRVVVWVYTVPTCLASRFGKTKQPTELHLVWRIRYTSWLSFSLVSNDTRDRNMIEGSLEVTLPTIWTDESRDGKSQKREEERRSRFRKGKKVAKHCVFPMICGSGGSKSRLAKAAGVEPGQMRDKKLHAVVARNTFPSQNVQSTSAPEHF